MKTLILLSISVVLGAVFAVGYIYLDQTSQTEAQSLKDDPSKAIAFTWKAKEIPIQTKNSKFALEVPESMIGNDWIIGFNPVENGQKERIFVEMVSWISPKDKMDFSRASDVENFPENAVTSVGGEAKLAEIGAERGASEKSLMILIESRKDAQISIKLGDEIIELDATNNLASSLKSDIAPAQVTNVAVLLNELTTRKVMAESRNRGFETKRKHKDSTNKKGENQ